jgi:hypothetical protein
MRRYSSQIAFYGSDPTQWSDVRDVFGSQANIRILPKRSELIDFLRCPSFPAGSVLFAEITDLPNDHDLNSALLDALKLPTFFLVLKAKGENPVVPADAGEHANLFFYRHSGETVGTAVHAFLTDLRLLIESYWLRTLNFEIQEEYESQISDPKRSPDRVKNFCERLLQLIEAAALHVYSLDGTGSHFKRETGAGTIRFGRLNRELLERRFPFEEACTTFAISGTAFAELLGRGESLKQEGSAFLSTFLIQDIPGLVFFEFLPLLDRSFGLEVSRIASREVMHLLRATLQQAQTDTLKQLTQIENIYAERRDVLWSVLAHLGDHFGAHGTSLLEPVDQLEKRVTFVKTFLHHGRKAHDSLPVERGFAHHCWANQKAILVNGVTEKDGQYIGEGLDFDPNNLELDSGRPIALPAIIATNTPQKENEESLMYFPLCRDGKVIGVLKIGDFDHPRAFDLRQLRDLRTFAGPITSLVRNIKDIEELKLELESKHTHDKMAKQAEELFFYREIALGIFHQVSNHLAISDAEILLVETLAESKGQSDMWSSATKARDHVGLAKELIQKAETRGKTLQPIGRRTSLLEEVVRPALEYAKKKIHGTNISLGHSLTSKDYDVYLDADLTKECLINILNNSVRAVKQNIRSAKKEIKVYVRDNSATKTVKVEVEDSGVGIEPHDFPKLFQAFFTTHPDGTGLGLYFTKGLVEHFKGNVEITKSQPGKGTNVVITLPLMED